MFKIPGFLVVSVQNYRVFFFKVPDFSQNFSNSRFFQILGNPDNFTYCMKTEI